MQKRFSEKEVVLVGTYETGKTHYYAFGYADPFYTDTRGGRRHQNITRNQYYEVQSFWGDVKKTWTKFKFGVKRLLKKKTPPLSFTGFSGHDCPSPFRNNYSTFSAVDMRVSVQKEGDETNIEVPLNTLQAFSFRQDEEKVYLNLVFILFTSSSLTQFLTPGDTFTFRARVANEYGKRANLSIKGLKLTVCGSGVSLDDIVMEEELMLSGKISDGAELQPWEEYEDVDPESETIETEMVDVTEEKQDNE